MKKNYTKLTYFLLFAVSFVQLSFSQTTEDFETETVGATTFTDNSQNFTITNGPGETNYDIEIKNTITYKHIFEKNRIKII